MEHQTEGPAGEAEHGRPEQAGERPATGEPRADGTGGPRVEGTGGPRVEGTGEPRVDAALARLDELGGLPVTEHRAVFEDVHRRLRDVLGELDTGQPREAGQAADTTNRPGR